MIESEGPNIFKEPIFLASSSPRRAEILSAVGWPFEIIEPCVDETREPGEGAVDYVRRLALAKARAGAARSKTGLILGADTVVVIEDQILGQPRDDDHARQMLDRLSGKWHDVVTGVALVRPASDGRFMVGHEVTRVRFKAISGKEIEWYIATGEPRGKAGAYGIQGHAALFIEEIQGDYFNVVGLPITLVYKLSREI